MKSNFLFVVVALLFVLLSAGSDGTASANEIGNRSVSMLLSDNFSSGTTMDPTKWYIPVNSTGATYFGRTHVRTKSLGYANPAIVGNNAVIALDTCDPSAGDRILGTDVISSSLFSLGQGVVFTVRAKVNSPVPGGAVFAIFPYALKDGSNTIHDELDWEFLTNYPNLVQANIYGAEPLGTGHPTQVPFPNGGTIFDWHTYQLIWLPTKVTWLIDGVAVRTVTTQSALPQGPMELHINAWAPDAGWTRAYNAALQPTSALDNKTYTMNVSSVEVYNISSATPASLQVTPTSTTMWANGGTMQVSATTFDSTGYPTNTSVSFTSSNTAVATVDQTSGIVTSGIAGTATITATAGGLTGTCAVTVNSFPASFQPQITSYPDYGDSGYVHGTVTGPTSAQYAGLNVIVYICVNGSYYIKPYYDQYLTEIASDGTWSANIVTGGTDQNATEIKAFLVPAGLAMPSGGQSSLSIFPSAHVIRPVIVPVLTSWTLSPTTMAINIGGATQQILATPLDQKGRTMTLDTQPTLTWTSDHASIASVTTDGSTTATASVTALTAGTANISVSGGGVSSNNTCAVTVKDPNTPRVDKIILSPSTITLTMGGPGQQIGIQVIDQHGDPIAHDIDYWAVQPNGIAWVNETGFLTTNEIGTEQITAEIGFVQSNTITVNVVAAPVLTSITVSPASTQINVGDTAQLKAADQDGKDITTSVSWVSNTTSVAKFNSTAGVVTGVGAGSATITATSAGVTSNSATVKVVAPPPVLTKITVSPVNVSVAVGATMQLKAVDQDGKDITTSVSWTSNTTSVAKFNSTAGVVTGVSAGSATVTAKNGSVVSNNCAVTVTATTQPLVLYSIALSPTDIELAQGSHISLLVLGYDQNKNRISIKEDLVFHIIGDSAVVTVSNTGVVTGGVAGTVQVYVTSGDVTSNTIEVMVSDFVVPTGPAIFFVSIPAYGKSGKVVGFVTGTTSFGEFEVLVFDNVDGYWWTKPTYKYSATKISRVGVWKANVVTGGHDARAIGFRAYLVPRGFRFIAQGEPNLDELDKYTFVEVSRLPRATSLNKITLSPKIFSLATGGNPLKLMVTTTSKGGYSVDTPITWLSTNPKAALVDQHGNVYPVGSGKGRIDAISGGKKASAKYSVQ